MHGKPVGLGHEVCECLGVLIELVVLFGTGVRFQPGEHILPTVVDVEFLRVYGVCLTCGRRLGGRGSSYEDSQPDERHERKSQ